MMDDNLRKFLLSEFGEKILLQTQFRGQDIFRFGKKVYKVSDLIALMKDLKKK